MHAEAVEDVELPGWQRRAGEEGLDRNQRLAPRRFLYLSNWREAVICFLVAVLSWMCSMAVLRLYIGLAPCGTRDSASRMCRSTDWCRWLRFWLLTATAAATATGAHDSAKHKPLPIDMSDAICDSNVVPNVCAPKPNCTFGSTREHQWKALKKLADDECRAAHSRNGAGSQRRMMMTKGSPEPYFSAGSNAGMGGCLWVTMHNITKRFNGKAFRPWGTFRLHGGMCGWEQYLQERRAMCRLARVAEPCGSPDAHGVQRAHFFPQLLAWNDADLTLVVTNDGCGLLSRDMQSTIQTEVLHASSLAASVGGRTRNCARQVSPPGACGLAWKHLSEASFQEQLDCAASQLQRANGTHFDADCKNIFVRPDGRLTLGDLDMSEFDGIPELNIYGQHLSQAYSRIYARRAPPDNQREPPRVTPPGAS